VVPFGKNSATPPTKAAGFVGAEILLSGRLCRVIKLGVTGVANQVLLSPPDSPA
jgi:hypothetical protein